MRQGMSRRQMLKTLGVGAGALGVAGLLPACAPSGGPGGQRSDGAGNAFGFAAWSLNEDAAKPVLESMVDNYAKAEGVQVKQVAYPYSEYLNQLTLQVRGGQFSGLAQLDIAWLGALAQLGALRDLSDIAEGAGYTSAALNSGRYQGKQLGLPWTTGAIGLVGNRELLDGAGVGTEFATVDDFESALREVKRADAGVVPYGAMTAVDGLKDVVAWMKTFGSPVIADGEVTIGDDASVEAVAWYKKLYDDGLIRPALNRFDARALFAQGKVAVYEDAVVGRSAVTEQAPDPDFGGKMVPIARPSAPGGSPTSTLWGHLLVVAEGDGADAAARMAGSFTADTETTVKYFEELGLPPTTKDALAASAVRQDDYTSAFTERITNEASPSPFWAYAKSSQLEATVAEAVQAVLVGDATPKDSMREAAEKLKGLTT